MTSVFYGVHHALNSILDWTDKYSLQRIKLKPDSY